MSSNEKPAQPTPTLTPEERERRYEELRRRQEIPRTFAECRDPSIEVRWVRKDDANDISLHEWLGFKIAKDNAKLPKDKRRFNTAIPPNEDGHYVCGDVILMEIPKDDYDFYLAEGVRRSTASVDGGKKVFIDEAKKREVPVFIRDKAGNVVHQ